MGVGLGAVLSFAGVGGIALSLATKVKFKGREPGRSLQLTRQLPTHSCATPSDGVVS